MEAAVQKIWMHTHSTSYWVPACSGVTIRVGAEGSLNVLLAVMPVG